jgi:hypothetical protein
MAHKCWARRIIVMVKLFYDYKKISGMMAKTEKAFMAVIKATV